MAAIGSAHGKAGLSTEREQFANAQQQSNKDKIRDRKDEGPSPKHGRATMRREPV